MKQYEITVKILVTVDDIDPQEEYREALYIGNQYAEMSMQYKSIDADKIVSVEAEAVE